MYHERPTCTCAHTITLRASVTQSALRAKVHFHIWKIHHFLDCREVWFVSSSITAISDPKALVWILTWHLSVAVRFRCIFPNSEVFSRWRRRSLNWMPRRVQESWGKDRVFRALPKLYSWRSPCISSGGKEKHLRVSAILLTVRLPK